jgi:hypothetical protein
MKDTPRTASISPNRLHNAVASIMGRVRSG